MSDPVGFGSAARAGVRISAVQVEQLGVQAIVYVRHQICISYGSTRAARFSDTNGR
jgi:hypothetical protein